MHNRNELHVKLYQVSGPRHVILRTQKMLAAELGISQFTLNRIMSEMVDDKRIKIIGKGRSASKRYVVYDPRTWCEEHHDFAGAEYARSILDTTDATDVVPASEEREELGSIESGTEDDEPESEDMPLLSSDD
jgi:hypothetical protein